MKFRFHKYKYYLWKLFPFLEKFLFEQRSARERDVQSNIETKIPKGYDLNLMAFWGCEYYTAEHLPRLLKRLKDIGWDKGRYETNQSLIEWITEARSMSRRGGWYNLGVITPSPEIAIDRIIALPKGFYRAFGQLHHISSDLFCITICFLLDDDNQTEMAEILNGDFETERVPLKNGFSIVDPGIKKRNLIKEIRELKKRRIFDWFKYNIPGIISSFDGKGFLTAELVFLVGEEPFSARLPGEQKKLRFLRASDYSVGFDTWISERTGAKVELGALRSENIDHVLVAIDRKSIQNFLKEEPWTTSDEHSMVYHIDDEFSSVLSLYGLNYLLDEIWIRISSYRDKQFLSQKEFRLSKNKVEQFIKGAKFSVDINPIIQDINDKSFSEFYKNDLIQFYSQEVGFDDNESLSFWLVSRLRRKARKLIALDKTISNQLNQYATLLSIKENIKMQRIMLTLTIFVFLLGLVQLLLTFGKSD